MVGFSDVRRLGGRDKQPWRCPHLQRSIYPTEPSKALEARWRTAFSTCTCPWLLRRGTCGGVHVCQAATLGAQIQRTMGRLLVFDVPDLSVCLVLPHKRQSVTHCSLRVFSLQLVELGACTCGFAWNPDCLPLASHHVHSVLVNSLNYAYGC